MNLTEALKQLDALNESVATDEYKQILSDIQKLDSEIQELQRQKAKSWENNYTKKFETETKQLNQLRKELEDLKKSYQEVWYTEREEDDDRYYYYDVYRDNPEKKAAVADKENELSKKLVELETRYEEIVASIKTEHETDFAAQTKSITDKSASLKNKQERKKEIFQKILEEERSELERILKKISDRSIYIDWVHFSIRKNKLIIPLVKKHSVTIDQDDFEFDTDGVASFNSTSVESNIDDEAIEMLQQIAYDLGVDDTQIDEWLNKKEINCPIPKSSWLLSNNWDTDLQEPDYHVGGWYGDGWNEPREFDFDFDDEVDCNIIFYLIKEI